MHKKRDSQKVHKPRNTTVDNRTVYLREHVVHPVPPAQSPEKAKLGKGARP